ncbi:hypothetical protein CPB84DRAFT_1787856 [Gymnopilus junonius]|uniref:Secreted protein n=1 Tax=Gymnopilus junonius TaxID=109634 RepID=A0A9P5NH27_GYMJU|nr:hypothetical protein CPB84DRAFT_1787856 [Gymnopilus junonius]
MLSSSLHMCLLLDIAFYVASTDSPSAFFLLNLYIREANQASFTFAPTWRLSWYFCAKPQSPLARCRLMRR